MNVSKARNFLILVVLILAGNVNATGRFINTSADIVLDRQTQLLWETRPLVEEMDYEQALQYCANLVIDQTTEWRLPKIKELASIIDEGSYHPSIYPYFKSESGYYWSVTLNAADYDFAWLVNFSDAHIHSYRKGTSFYVRCVKNPDTQ